MPTGRPTKYNDELVAKARDYLVTYKAEYDHEIPSIVGLAVALDVRTQTLYNWAQDEDKEFFDILAKCKEYQEIRLISGGLNGDFNSNITKLVLGKHGYHDKQDNEHSGPGGAPIQTQSAVIASEMNPAQAAEIYADLMQ